MSLKILYSNEPVDSNMVSHFRTMALQCTSPYTLKLKYCEDNFTKHFCKYFKNSEIHLNMCGIIFGAKNNSYNNIFHVENIYSVVFVEDYANIIFNAEKYASNIFGTK